MNKLPELQSNPHWRMAVWALRIGYVGLAIAAVGLIMLATGSAPSVLAVGVIIWLACAVVLATGFLWARSELSEQDPGFWAMRLTLLHDTVHAKPGLSDADAR